MLGAGILVACAIEVSGPELELVGPSLLSASSVIISEYPSIASNSSSSYSEGAEIGDRGGYSSTLLGLADSNSGRPS